MKKILSAFFVLAIASSATPLPSGGNAVLSSSIGDPTGTFVTSLSTSFTAATFSGLLDVDVFDSGAGLDFWYRATNNAGSAHAMGRVTVNGYDPLFTVDISQRSDLSAGIQAFASADRSTYGTVGLSFGNTIADKLGAGESSYWAVLRTDAVAFTTVTGSAIDGSSVDFSTLGPDQRAGNAPEPASFLIAGAGLVGLGLFRRRTKQKKQKA